MGNTVCAVNHCSTTQRVRPDPETSKRKSQHGSITSKSLALNIDYVIPIHPKQDSEMAFLKEALSKNFIVESLSKEDRKRFIGAMRKEHLEDGAKVIKQGDIGDYFYVVESGKIKFFVDDILVGACGAGGSFGELALLYDCPRTATCVADDSSVVWKVDQKTFRNMLAENVMKESEGVVEILRKVPFLSNFDEDSIFKLANAFVPKTYKKGERIFSKGEIGKTFFVIKDGSVKVHDIGMGNSVFLDKALGAGDSFGEMALVSGEPRSANITATADSLMLCLTVEIFQSMFGSENDLVKHSVWKRVLEGMPLFASSNIDPGTIVKLSKLFVVKTFEKGSTIVKAGNPVENQGVYIIDEGSVTIYYNNGTITKLSNGDYFGGTTLKLAKGTISERTIQFAEKTTCSVLTKSSIESIIISTSRLGKSIRTHSTGLENITIGDLDIFRIITIGLNGKIRLVCKKTTNHPYAMKIVKKKLILDKKKLDSVTREKNLLDSLSHPFIINLRATFQDRHNLYMLYDFVQGGELRSLMRSVGGNNGGVSYQEAQFYTACIVESLCYLHSHHICYRSLTPQDIFIDKKGYCILTNFSEAKYVSTKSLTLCGTPEYLAPEVILCKGHDQSADTWALGVLLYELLLGYTPFISKTNNDQVRLFKKIVKLKYSFPTNEKLTFEAQKLIHALLKKEPSDRLDCKANLNGDAEIRRHPFFDDIEWKYLYEKKYKAPWRPEPKGALDPSYFGMYEEQENEYQILHDLTEEEQSQFKDF